MVLPAFPTLSETFIVSKLLGLLDRGWDVQVVCGRSDPREWERFPALLARERELRRRVRVSPPVEPRWQVPPRLLLVLARCLVANPRGTLRYLARGFRRFGPDALRRLYLDAELVAARPALVHFEFGALLVGREYLKDLLGVRLVASFRGHDLNFSGLDTPGYYDEVWRCADAVHALGEDLWRRAQRRGCPADLPHALIPPAIDAEYFQPESARPLDRVGTLERPLRVLSVGRLKWKKGHEYALQAVRRLLDQGVAVHYRIVGGGSFLEAVAFARHQLGLEEHVELLGALARERVRDEMRWADVFLHAAVSEGFCNAVLEAQAMRLPVVCSDADGLPENVADGVTGFVVPRRDPAALAEKLATLAADPDLRRRMGEAGRERVLARFRPEDQVAAFERLYALALGQETGP